MALLQQKSAQASTYASASSGDEIQVVLGCHCGIVGELCSDGIRYMYLIEFMQRHWKLRHCPTDSVLV